MSETTPSLTPYKAYAEAQTTWTMEVDARRQIGFAWNSHEDYDKDNLSLVARSLNRIGQIAPFIGSV